MFYSLFLVLALAAPGSAPPPLDSATKTRVIDAAVKALGDYVYPVTGDKAIALLQANRDKYMQIDDPDAFAQAVTSDLFASTHDLHEKLYYSPTEIPDEKQPTKHDEELLALTHANLMQGIRDVHRLRGNIGYIDIRLFTDAKEAAKVYDGAMAMLADTDALIIDVRKNGGGWDATDYLMGYFFAKPTNVNDFYFRGHPVQRAFTAAHVGGRRYLGKPIYILTAQYTASAAEEFSYDMQTQGRATLVGATTRGAANPGEMVKLADHFKMYVSLGYVKNAVTGKNWEGTGVIPDVPVDENIALLKAYTLALGAAKTTLDATALEQKEALADPQKALDLSFKL